MYLAKLFKGMRRKDKVCRLCLNSWTGAAGKSSQGFRYPKLGVRVCVYVQEAWASELNTR